MQMFGCPTSPTPCDVEALLYVQEAGLDKFRHELATSNVAETSQEENNSRGAYSFNYGRGRFSRGRSHGRGRNTTGNLPHVNCLGSMGTESLHVGIALMKISCLRLHLVVMLILQRDELPLENPLKTLH